jgi:Mg-chelatase subunit ChlD
MSAMVSGNASHKADTARFAEALRAETATARDAVTRLVRSRAQDGQDRYLTSGRLDRRSIARAAAGAPNTLARRTYIPAVNTAVVVLVDMSDSMTLRHGRPLPGLGPVSRIGAAAALAAAVCDAADGAGAQSAAFGFFYRIQGGMRRAHLGTLKDWHEQARAVRRRMLEIYPDGGTALAPAISAGADMLHSRRGVQRRIVFAMTDGVCSFKHETVAEATRLAARRGVETVGFIIGTELSEADARRMFTDFVIVPSPADIAKAGLAALADRLAQVPGGRK